MIQFTFITKIISWLTDPKNRQLIAMGVIMTLIILLMTTCGRVSVLKGQVNAEKKETQRKFKDLERI